jgi:hypothetical protein
MDRRAEPRRTRITAKKAICCEPAEHFRIYETSLTRTEGVVRLEVLGEHRAEHHERPDELSPEQDRKATL